ncbi:MULTISPECIES: hypothetical protein [unclassified Calothrix]|nr:MULTISPECIES: hypothetical protein [unclassified Calothrix]
MPTRLERSRKDAQCPMPTHSKFNNLLHIKSTLTKNSAIAIA